MKRLAVVILMLVGIDAGAQQVEPLIFREKTYDFGGIEEEKGAVDHEFVFTNNSGRPVRIVSVQASCGCTTPGWSQTAVPTGKTGFVKASFDPRGRPGYFNKTLTVTTDFDVNPVILQIKGQVLTGTHAEATDFPVANGNLYFATKSFNFEKVFINKPSVEKQFPVMNKGTDTIQFTGVVKPSYLKVDLPAQLAPQEKGFVRISYDAHQKNQFGFASDNIQIGTNDVGLESKSVSVFASLEEYYATPVGEEATRAPSLFLKEQNIDLGRYRQGADINRAVTVTNMGKRNLQIKAVQGNCPCISGEVEKNMLKPGDSTVLRISFRPQNREGTQLKAIALYTNDPRNPVQRVNVQVYVGDH